MKKKLLIILFAVVAAMSASAQVPLPYTQNFEGNTFPPTGWQLFAGSTGGWVRNTTVSGYGLGTACTSFDNFTTASGSYYGIRLPSMNFSAVVHPYITFDVAYAKRPTGSSDIFALYWSPNGSSGWQLLQNYSGTALTTAPATASLFVPTSLQWQTKTFSLASLIGQSFVRLAIEDDCANGNMIYVDNIRVVDSAFASVEETDFSKTIFVSSNPFANEISIVSSEFSITKVELYNITGSVVKVAETNSNKYILDNLFTLPKGMYMLKVYSGNRFISRKLLKE